MIASMANVGNAQLDCVSLDPASVDDAWCNINCNFNPPFCPGNLCRCTGTAPTVAPPSSPTVAPPSPTAAPPSPTMAPPSPTNAPPAPSPSPPSGDIPESATGRPFGLWVYIIDQWQTTTVLPSDISRFATSVSLSFVCPLAVLNGWTPEVQAQSDLNYPGNMRFGSIRSANTGAPGKWSGKFKELISNAHSKGVYPILSVGGATWGEEWKSALNSGAVNLGNKLADIALNYNVGIEIDFEDNYSLNSGTVQQQVLDMIYAFRARAGNKTVLTVDVGAASGDAGRFLNNMFVLARDSGQFSWINAMVDDDGGSLDFNRYSSYWQTFLGKGQEMVVPSLYARRGNNQACPLNSPTRDSGVDYVLGNGKLLIPSASLYCSFFLLYDNERNQP
jgi:hypothetical protein